MSQYAKTRYGGLWVLFGEFKSCIIEARNRGLACAFTENVMTHGLSLGVAEPAILAGAYTRCMGWYRTGHDPLGLPSAAAPTPSRC